MRITCVAVLIVVASASAQVPVNANEPYWPGATWETTTPERSGLDAGKLEATAVFVLAQDSTSFLVIRGGRIVVEKYGDGGGVKVKRRIASATKSMTAILVGMALDAGKFEDLDQPVGDFLPAWKETRKAEITLRHLLSMTSGLGPRRFTRQRPTADQFLLQFPCGNFVSPAVGVDPVIRSNQQGRVAGALEVPQQVVVQNPEFFEQAVNRVMLPVEPGVVVPKIGKDQDE